MDKMFSIKEVMQSKEFQKDAPEKMRFLVPKVLREIERGEHKANQQKKEIKKKNAA